MSVLKRVGGALGSVVRRDPAAQLAGIMESLARGWSEGTFAELQALAAKGFAPAQHRLGQMFESAEGVVQSLPDSVHWYRLAAEQGHIASQVRLGLIYFLEPVASAGMTAAAPGEGPAGGSAVDTLAQFFPRGLTVRQDFAEALKWNRLAAEQGSAEAQARLGHQLALGLGLRPDLLQAEKWFAAAAQQGNAEGELGLGLMYAGQHGSTPNLRLAAAWLQRAAGKGNRIAQYGFGKLLLHGEGTTQDVDFAMLLLEKSAAQDYAPAMYLLGMAYWQGAGQPVDLSRAETWLRRAVTRGHGEGACALAEMLMSRPDDDGVEAAALFREQAEGGNKRAAAALAELYTFGRGLPRDAREAARWRTISQSEVGPESLNMLASLHAEGIGAPQDFSTAARLLHESAEKGSVDALYNLGWLFRLGKGVPLDLKAAESCWLKALRAGSSEAAFQLGLLHSESDANQAYEAAATAFAHAAKAGHSRARANLALMVAEGTGVRKDPVRALALLREAAASGDPSVQSALGFQLLEGLAGKPDLAEVRTLLRKAAEGGEARAQAWMGDFFRLGLEGPPDFQASEVWYRRAAAQGHVGSLMLLATAIDSMSPSSKASEEEAFGLWLAAASAGDATAQFHVGERYARGLGCAADAVLGAEWLARAAENGSESARAALSRRRAPTPQV